MESEKKLRDETVYQSASPMDGRGIMSSRPDQSTEHNNPNLSFIDSEGEMYLRSDLGLNAQANDQNHDNDEQASTPAHGEFTTATARNDTIDVIAEQLLECIFTDYHEVLDDIHEYDHHIRNECERTNLFLNRGIIKGPSGTILHPNHEEYRLESKRLASFELWPEGMGGS